MICSTFYGNCQTYIGPLIGYDNARIQSIVEEDDHVYTIEKGYVHTSLVLGIKIEHYFSNSVYFSFKSSYTHKYIKTTEVLLADPVIGMEFNYFLQSLSIRYKIFKSIYAGVGVNYNFVNNIRIDSGNEAPFPLKFIDHDKGLHFSVGIKYSDFDLELYYYKSTNNLNIPIFDIMKMEPISSYGVNISYDLKLFDRINLFDKKGQSCPAF